MRTIKTLIRVLFLFSFIALLIYIPFLIDRYGRDTLVPYVENFFSYPNLSITDLSVNSVEYAFPIGVRFKGVSATIIHKSADFNEQSFIFSTDSIHLRLPYTKKVFEGEMPLEIFLKGGIIRSKQDLLSIQDQSTSLQSLNDRRFIFEKVDLQNQCSWTIFKSFYEIDHDQLRACVLTNWQERINMISSFLEVVFLDEKLRVALNNFQKNEIEFGELQMNELSAKFRSPFSIEERNLFSKYPLYALDLLTFKQFAEEESVKLYPEDIKRLEGFQNAFYHYIITSYFGESFSKLVTPNDDNSQNIEETERLKFFAALGRLSKKKGVTLEDFKDPSFISPLLDHKNITVRQEE